MFLRHPYVERLTVCGVDVTVWTSDHNHINCETNVLKKLDVRELFPHDQYVLVCERRSDWMIIGCQPHNHIAITGIWNWNHFWPATHFYSTNLNVDLNLILTMINFLLFKKRNTMKCFHITLSVMISPVCRIHHDSLSMAKL